jgi:flagellar basal body-associated protein FliL
MTKRHNRKKRSKLTILLLAPIMALTFIVGWSLYWIGNTKSKQKNSTTPKIPTEHDSIQLIVIPSQEEQTIPNN